MALRVYKIPSPNHRQRMFAHFNMRKSVYINQGFSLVEILVAIAIIGIIVSITVFTTRGSLETTRDTQRKSDLKQYQTAIESYANRNNGLFPINATTVALSTTHCVTLGLGANCTEDPKRSEGDLNWIPYRYITNTAGTLYVLWSQLETVPSGSAAQFWVVCSTGKSGATATAPTTFTCPF